MKYVYARSDLFYAIRYVLSAATIPRIFHALLIALIAATPRIVAAQDNLRIIGTTDPVQIFVNVTANDGTPIDGLLPGAFQLNEDGSSQAITTTISTTNVPVTTVFVMDYSPSVRNASAIAPMEQAVKSFINLMGTGDEAAVVKFNGAIGTVVSQDLTSDKTLLDTAVDTDPGPGSYTNLYDAIDKAIDVISQSTNTTGTRSIVVLSDGDDNFSTITLDSLAAKLDAAKIPVITIGYGDNIKTNILQGIADGTGGAYYSASNDSSLFTTIYTNLSERLNHEYLLTFSSAVSDCNVHDLQVQVATGEGPKTYDGTFRRCFSTDPLPTAKPISTGGGSSSGGGGGIALGELVALLLLSLSYGFIHRAERQGITRI